MPERELERELERERAKREHPFGKEEAFLHFGSRLLGLRYMNDYN